MKTILLHVTQSHINQARALRRTGMGNVSCRCPVALAAKDHFGRICMVGRYMVGVFNDEYEYVFIFDHNGAEWINRFDDRQEVTPTTITLIRS